MRGTSGLERKMAPRPLTMPFVTSQWCLDCCKAQFVCYPDGFQFDLPTDLSECGNCHGTETIQISAAVFMN